MDEFPEHATADGGAPSADPPPEKRPADGLELRPVPGSGRLPAAGTTTVGPVDPNERVEVTLVLRRSNPLPEDYSEDLTPEEFAENYGASEADITLVTSTLTALGAEILQTHAPSRRVRIAGSAATLSRAFGTTLQQATSATPTAEGAHRHRTGELSVPAALDEVVTAVLGLDDRPQSRALLQVVPAAQVATSYTPLELAEIYEFPANTDGSGQTIAIIELGGGFGQADLDAYFASLNLRTPQVTAVGVDGASNVAGQDPNGADGEVLLDIEVAGAIAPGATILVYFAPNTDAGFLDAVSEAAHASPPPVAMSISWGQSEDGWTGQARTAMDNAFADAAALGVTVTAAAGDNGSSDTAGVAAGTPHVDFPASSPHVLACGGTTLHANTATATVTSEVVWNDGTAGGATGGGVSDAFGLPAWQQQVGVPAVSGRSGRGVPDVAAVADPRTGYQVRVDGSDLVIGGTSAVAPLWAGLVARMSQASGRRFGLLNQALYADGSSGTVPPGFRDITQGNNGAWPAGAGWDACTGLGVPIGSSLVAALEGQTPGG
ncbi:kumamolisin. Serine peptidase. MEROPS family S53 [Frankineae bacterium MT45]|nr:kumamolisin. Serine peptidase. MEROPS family S53 [Frankineae bacterium MT45]